MQHEKIFKNDDGSRVKVVVELLKPFGQDAHYRPRVFLCDPGKRTWRFAANVSSSEYRAMSLKERDEFGLQSSIETAGIARIEQTAEELWSLLRPKMFHNIC